MTEKLSGSLTLTVHPDRAALGRVAAAAIAADLRRLAARQPSIRMMFAAAPSQLETLVALRHEADVPWGQVTAFHMDEYLALAPGSPQLFGRWLGRHLFDHVPLAGVELLDPERPAEDEALRYAALLTAAPIDIVLLGIGDNGHLAFNDPGADLDDPQRVRPVRLDQRSREQQVSDGQFPDLASVPTSALTVTVPGLLAARRVVCVAPGPRKARAVRDALLAPISGECPATALRTHAAVSMHLDRESAGLVAQADRPAWVH